MATQRYISTSFWEDKWVRSLDPAERYLYMYLLTNPLTTIAGVYQITMDRIAFDTGYDERTLAPMFDRFKESGKALYHLNEWIILPSWPKHQKWQVRARIKTGIENVLMSLPPEVFGTLEAAEYQYPINSLKYPIDSLKYPIDSLKYPSNYPKSEFKGDPEGEPDLKGEGEPDSKGEVDDFAKSEADPNIENEDALKRKLPPGAVANEFKEKTRK